MEQTKKYVISIDVGIIHLAIVGAFIEEDFSYTDIDFCELVDITNFVRNCNILECDLYHERSISDWMAHFFKNKHELLSRASYILVERQPLCGLVAVQELINTKYRDKTILVQPSAMHKHFDIGTFTYDHRKDVVCKIANSHLKNFPHFIKNERKHDMADAYCILSYWCNFMKKIYIRDKKLIEWKRNNSSFVAEMESFKYNI